MRAFRYRIYPTREQADPIRRTAGCVRYVYNGLLGAYEPKNLKREKVKEVLLSYRTNLIKKNKVENVINKF